MQKYNITVSPDFKPDKIAGWYVFNTFLQRTADLGISMNLFGSFDELRQAVKDGKIDLIYANPFDAAMLVNEYKFTPLVRPTGKNDECVIVVQADSALNSVEDLTPGTQIAATNDPATNMIGMRMLEAADLDESNTSVKEVVSFVAVAKQVMDGDAQIGFLLKEAYDELSNIVKSRLKVLVSSEISVIYHCLMAGPKLHDQKDKLLQILLGMNSDEKSKSILTDLGFEGFEEMSDEDAAFMIDLMETLRS